MIRKKILTRIVLLFLGISFYSCNVNTDDGVKIAEKNQILLLKVDYTTDTFEGGNELTFEKQTNTFTVSTEYKSPGDFGNIKLHYSEINELIFNGDIIWMGRGNIHFPENWWNETNNNCFKLVPEKDYWLPKNGFVQINNDASTTIYKIPDKTTNEIQKAWGTIQRVKIVRDYLQANPEETVKVYFYQPSVGVGNPADWKWIFILKRGGGTFNTTADILFERYYINHAWGYRHKGFLIDKNGQIFTYEETDVNHHTSTWNFPDTNGYITERALKENLSSTEISQARIDVNELDSYAKLINKVKENDFTEQHQGYDMGAMVNVCYVYNEKTQTYKQILLSENGDWVRTNNSPAAKTIDEWLNSLVVK